MATALDTHEHYKRLRDAGFDERQAEAVLALFFDQVGDLATKNDLRTELETFRNETAARLRPPEDRRPALMEQLDQMERRVVRYIVLMTALLAAWATILPFIPV